MENHGSVLDGMGLGILFDISCFKIELCCIHCSPGVSMHWLMALGRTYFGTCCVCHIYFFLV